VGSSRFSGSGGASSATATLIIAQPAESTGILAKAFITFLRDQSVNAASCLFFLILFFIWHASFKQFYHP
jgi:hypothetical protein